MTDHWHLHATVRPAPEWTLDMTVAAMQKDFIERPDIKLVRLVNCMPDPALNYHECISTRHYEGSESAATYELFKMCCVLRNAGWRITRLKLEGDWRAVCIPLGRALYYETHVKISNNERIVALDMGFALSTTPRSIFATYRHPAPGNVFERAVRLSRATAPYQPARTVIDAAVIDTAPHLDDAWINQRRTA